MISQTISHYRILKKLGAGGMGEVYLAEDIRLGRMVAIKFLPPDSMEDERAKKRLIREAQAAATLDHPNICPIHEVGEERGHSFIVMQYVEGETLASKMSKKALELGESLNLAVQITDALAAAHSRGIIHRDIKPKNIMITAHGQAYVLDFGLAKVIREGHGIESSVETESLLTEPGAIVGTSLYMSPEQVRGETLDERSDIFSFGAVLYEMVSGRQPFASESRGEGISAILTRDPPRLARYTKEVPAELERIVSKALRKDREERYQTARDLLIDLKSLKEELEFEAKLGRSVQPDSSEAEARSRQAIVEATKKPGDQTGELAPTTATGLEYLITVVRDHKFAFAALALLLLALVGVGLYRLAGLGQEKAIETMAVLPFVNESADPHTEYLSDGITESLINSLSQLAKLRVLARSTVFRYKGRDLDPRKAGQDLKVQAVLTGRVLQRGDTPVIRAELMDVAYGSQLWGEEYNRKLPDILAMQGEIAREISEKLRLRLSGRERLTKRHTENPEAYQLYIRGRYHLEKRTPEELKKGTEYLEQAIRKDPLYGLAHAALADAYNLLGVYRVLPPRDANIKMKAEALEALKIDETLAEAHIVLAAVKRRHDHDWAGAERELRRALDLNPNYSMAHQRSALLLTALGRFDEAFAAIERARSLDPLSLIINLNVGEVLYHARRYEQAIEHCLKALEMDPYFRQARIQLGLCYAQKTRFPEAVAELQKALSLSRDAVALGDLGYVYAISGDRADAQKILVEVMELSRRRYVSPFDIAKIHIGLGDKDAAFEWLDRAYEEQAEGLRTLDHG